MRWWLIENSIVSEPIKAAGSVEHIIHKPSVVRVWVAVMAFNQFTALDDQDIPSEVFEPWDDWVKEFEPQVCALWSFIGCETLLDDFMVCDYDGY